MSKLGISLRIDVTKIDKARLYAGDKGTYLNITTFIDPHNPSEHGSHGFITQELTKEERDQKVQLPILGNAKVFYNQESVNPHANGVQQANNQLNEPAQNDFDDDDIPF
jgi:hypothetical protein